MRFHSRLVAFVATLASGATPAVSQSAIDIRTQSTKDVFLTLCPAEASGLAGRISTEITATSAQQTSRAAPCAQEYLKRLVGLALQLQGSREVSPLRHGLMASPPDRPRDDERRLDPTLG